jgi:hypothetical protein
MLFPNASSKEPRELKTRAEKATGRTKTRILVESFLFTGDGFPLKIIPASRL